MFKYMLHFSLMLYLSVLLSNCVNRKGDIEHITPNQFKGSDIQRIQSAIDRAKGTTNKIVIPARNSNGTNIWKVDSAILLPSNMTVILENCTIQLSDSCRDNMFRSNNAGAGIINPEWNNNISIVGIGDVVLRGADNPRATGDGNKKLVTYFQPKGRVSYGSDAGKKGMKQTGDWRNILILIAYVDGFKLTNVAIENTHAWSVSFERTINADISDIRINNSFTIIVNGETQRTSNKDGINLRHGCKNFRVNNISGRTSDDFIALSILGLNGEDREGGSLNSTMVTTRNWRGPEDDTENIIITNIRCLSHTRGVSIRANDSASIRNVYINGLIWEGLYNAILIGGKGYGKPSLPGRINNIHAMNIMGNGKSLIHIEEAVADCYIINGIYSGESEDIITYNIDKDKTRDIISENLINTR